MAWYRRPMDAPYFLTVWACLVGGIVFVFSASYPLAGRPDASGLAGNPYTYLLQHSQHVVLGLAAMLLVSYLRPQTIRLWSAPAFVVMLGLVAMTFVSPWGVWVKGAARWLDLPGLPAFQPSELAKVAFVAFVASTLASKDERRESSQRAYLQVLAATGAVVVLLLMQPDQGMATIFILISLSMLFLAGASMAWLAPLAMGLAGGGLLLAYMVPYRWDRITAVLNPEGSIHGAGYHNMNMLISLSRGGFCGMGLGMSPDKWHWLPAPHTDSMFCVIGGELGFIGAAMVLLAIGLLTYRAARIAMASGNAFAWYLTLGVGAAIALQGLIHVAVTTSCIPCTGLTLPFISAGGTSILSVSIAAGMVLSVSRYCNKASTE